MREKAHLCGGLDGDTWSKWTLPGQNWRDNDGEVTVASLEPRRSSAPRPRRIRSMGSTAGRVHAEMNSVRGIGIGGEEPRGRE